MSRRKDKKPRKRRSRACYDNPEEHKRRKQTKVRQLLKRLKEKSADGEQQSVVEGRRIVEISVTARQLQCTSCKESISSEDVHNENEEGLVPMSSVTCRKCLGVSSVPTRNERAGPSGGQIWVDTNTTSATESAMFSHSTRLVVTNSLFSESGYDRVRIHDKFVRDIYINSSRVYQKGEEARKELIEHKVDGEPQVIKRKQNFNSVLKHLKETK